MAIVSIDYLPHRCVYEYVSAVANLRRAPEPRLEPLLRPQASKRYRTHLNPSPHRDLREGHTGWWQMSLLVDWDWKWDFVHARGRMTNPPSADRVAIGGDTGVSDSGACRAASASLQPE